MLTGMEIKDRKKGTKVDYRNRGDKFGGSSGNGIWEESSGDEARIVGITNGKTLGRANFSHRVN